MKAEIRGCRGELAEFPRLVLKKRTLINRMKNGGAQNDGFPTEVKDKPALE